MRRIISVLGALILCAVTLISCAGSSIEVDPDSQWLPGLAEVTEELQEYQIYLVGESHGVAATYPAELELIKYFNQVHGIRDLIFEEGFAASLVFQEYLNTGDENLLKRNIETTEGSAAYTNENYEFYKSLYEYNMSLPEDSRLQVYGVDIEHQYDLALWYLKEHITVQQRDEKLTQLFSAENSQETVDLIESILSDYENYEKVLGEFAHNAYYILDGMLQYHMYYEITDMDDSVRENYFAENTLTALEQIGDNKSLAIFGAAHTELSGKQERGFPMVSDQILEQYGTEKVTSISFAYYKCTYRDGQNNTGKADTTLGKILRKRTKLDTCVFPLSTADKNNTISRHAASCPYAILIQNSAASTTYGE